MERFRLTNQLLKDKFNLHKSPEVDVAVSRQIINTEKKVSQDPLIRIQIYLDRLNNIVHPKSISGLSFPDKKERNLEMLKHNLYDKFVVKTEEISEKYWDSQRLIFRDMGLGVDYGDWEEYKQAKLCLITEEQKISLAKWVDYLTSSDFEIAPAFKYYVFRSILNMGEYNKAKKAFPQRSRGTTQPFPEINREALAYVLDTLGKKYQNENIDMSSYSLVEQLRFAELIQGERFDKLYAFALETVTNRIDRMSTAMTGKWVKYLRKSDHKLLVEALHGFATGWCTAREPIAKAQLELGDFYIYFSNDQQGDPIFPRVGIRMKDTSVAEIRGVAVDQNLEPEIVRIVEEKLNEFPDSLIYKKKLDAMEMLNSIEKKQRRVQILTKDELRFLYEIDERIEGFGYYRDPRIAEIRYKRNTEDDMLTVLGCEQKQVARSIADINVQSKAFVGILEPGIFEVLQKFKVEQIYTSFPDGRIVIKDLTIGDRTKRRLVRELIRAKIDVSSYASNMIHARGFTTLSTAKTINTVELRVESLGFDENPSIREIYAKADDLGLELCSHEVALCKRLAFTDQPAGDYVAIAMKPIFGQSGHQFLFSLEHHGDKMRLGYCHGRPDFQLYPSNKIMFTLRQPNERVVLEKQKTGFLQRFFAISNH